MLQNLFDHVSIPHGRPLLVHTRLRHLHRRTGISYSELTESLLQCLLGCNPSHLLVPAYTIYSFYLSRIFHREYSHSEVGRFSEELRRRGFKRTFDPMYSMLDITNSLPDGLDYKRTFGRQSVCDFLCRNNGIVINVDMPGFYSTPVHAVELEHRVPYRYVMELNGHMQKENEGWQQISYTTYIRAVDRHGSGSFPPYNQQRRTAFLRERNIITEWKNQTGHLAWASLKDFCTAIDQALSDDPFFLVDP